MTEGVRRQLGQCDQNIILLNELAGNQVIFGEVPIISFTPEVEESVKQALEGICPELVNPLETRLKTQPVFVTLSNSFSEINFW